MTANAGNHVYNTGDVITAAQVQYNLQTQTVMYFATTTARDAALTGSILVDGMVSYTPATGLMYYNGTAWTAVGGGSTSPLTTKGDVWGYSTTNARIPVGSNNQVLTADSTQTLGVKWATPTSGSMTSLASGTLSGTSVNLTSISGSYQRLSLQVSNWYDSGNNSLQITINADTASNYNTGQSQSASANAAFINSSLGGNAAANGFFIEFDFINYSSTTTYKTGTYNIAAPTVQLGRWSYTGSTSAITSIQIKNGGGTSWSGGTYTLYGVN